MKNIIFLCFVFLITGCSDEFLDNVKNREPRITKDPNEIHLEISTDYYEYSVTVAHAGNAEYSIGHLPKWVKMRYMKGTFKEGKASLKFTINKSCLPLETGNYKSYILLLINDVGIHEIPVHYQCLAENNIAQ
ncbi:MAG: hypothetical protein LBQ60_21655, partial [Bacteroidales bacterium]|nr:hypothetical protein [Bacteroidales bacterium]